MTGPVGSVLLYRSNWLCHFIQKCKYNFYLKVLIFI
jgi:hypothetical protein